MNYFLGFMAILSALAFIGGMLWLANDNWPERTRSGIVANTICWTVIGLWAAYLLVRQSA